MVASWLAWGGNDFHEAGLAGRICHGKLHVNKVLLGSRHTFEARHEPTCRKEKWSRTTEKGLAAQWRWHKIERRGGKINR